LLNTQDGEHVQLGDFADYMNVPQTSNNFTGIGGRASFQAYKQIKVEGESVTTSSRPLLGPIFRF
jgi:hypothetical protein